MADRSQNAYSYLFGMKRNVTFSPEGVNTLKKHHNHFAFSISISEREIICEL